MPLKMLPVCLTAWTSARERGRRKASSHCMLQSRCSPQPLCQITPVLSAMFGLRAGWGSLLSPFLATECRCFLQVWVLKSPGSSADTKLNVVSSSHNLPIPDGSWDEQKHAGVRMCKVTILNYFSLAACARECSWCITHEKSCGEGRWRRAWGSCSPWLQCG